MLKQFMRCILLAILCLALTACTKQEETPQTPQEPVAVKIEHMGCENIYPSPDGKHDICTKIVGDVMLEFDVEFYLNCAKKIHSVSALYVWNDTEYYFEAKWLNQAQVLLYGEYLYDVRENTVKPISIFDKNEYVTGVYINEEKQEIVFSLSIGDFKQKIVTYDIENGKVEDLVVIPIEDIGMPAMDICFNNIVQVDNLIYFEIALSSPAIYVLDVNTKEYKLHLADHRLIGLKDGELVVKEDDSWWGEATE